MKTDIDWIEIEDDEEEEKLSLIKRILMFTEFDFGNTRVNWFPMLTGFIGVMGATIYPQYWQIFFIVWAVMSLLGLLVYSIWR